ncbi:MAG: hypothetical protein KY469_10555 [Actinobacteria bacterium]|nr:hypothetical protein [Actinomycetota bacterium]
MSERRWTDQDVAEAVERSTVASGVPLKVEDPATLARIATIARTVDTVREVEAGAA